MKSLSPVWLLATPWTAAHQLLCPWDFPSKTTGVGCHCPTPVVNIKVRDKYKNSMKSQFCWWSNSFINVSQISVILQKQIYFSCLSCWLTNCYFTEVNIVRTLVKVTFGIQALLWVFLNAIQTILDFIFNIPLSFSFSLSLAYTHTHTHTHTTVYTVEI